MFLLIWIFQCWKFAEEGSNSINARSAKARYLQKRCLIRYNVFVTRQEAERLKYDSDETVCYDTGLPRSIEVVIIKRQLKRQRRKLANLEQLR